jgi:hypothetical protein
MTWELLIKSMMTSETPLSSMRALKPVATTGETGCIVEGAGLELLGLLLPPDMPGLSAPPPGD